jgi:hypothetical protein
MNLGNDKALWLLFIVPSLLIPAYIWCFWRKAKALKVLASSDMLRKINVSVSLKKQIQGLFTNRSFYKYCAGIDGAEVESADSKDKTQRPGCLHIT